MPRNVQRPYSNTKHAHFQGHVFPQQVHQEFEQHPHAQLSEAAGEFHPQPSSRFGTLRAGNGASRPHSRDPVVHRGGYSQPASTRQPSGALEHALAATPQNPERHTQYTNSGTALPTVGETHKRPRWGVRQDKDRNSCDRAASRQPAAVNKCTRSQATNRKSARIQKDSADNRPCVPVQVWVSPVVKAELSRVASQDGLSLSSAGAAFLQRGIQQNVDMQYGALLRPVIEDAIAKQMAGIATRLTWLLVRIAFDAGQTRSLVTNILGRQQGVTQPLLKTILEGSCRSAKANIMRRTPQISELISSVEKWMTEDNMGVSPQKNT